MISCPGCGQSMRFDPTLQMMYCDYCDTKLEPDYVSAGKTASEYNEPETFSSTLYTCPQCGGEILSDSDTAITFCSFCGVSIELKGRTVQMAAPSKVIPFRIDKKGCAQKYSSFIKSAIYAPDYLRSETQLDKIRGIYMPYWIYDFSIDSTLYYTASTSHRSGDYIITENYSLEVKPQGEYKGVSFDASSSFSDELSQAIAPYNIREAVPFSVSYLSGFYADTADVEASVYEAGARIIVGSAIDYSARNLPEFSRYNTTPNPQRVGMELQSSKNEMAYFPVYFLANRHKNGLVSYAVMNGQTGKVAADVPIDYKKYLIGTLILAIPIMIILDMFLVLRADKLAIVGVIFAIISYIIANGELNLLYTKNNNLNDQGLLSVRAKKRKEEEERQRELERQYDAASENASSDTSMYGGSIVDPRINAEAAAEAEKLAAKAAAAKSSSSLSGISFLSGVQNVCGTIALICVIIALEEGVFQLLLGAVLFGLIWLILLPFTSPSNKTAKHAMVESVSVTVTAQPFSQKLPVLIKPIAAIIGAVILFAVNPYQDEVYYACSFGIMAVVIIAFIDVIKLHNKLTQHLPKQFDKRGGDE